MSSLSPLPTSPSSCLENPRLLAGLFPREEINGYPVWLIYLSSYLIPKDTKISALNKHIALDDLLTKFKPTIGSSDRESAQLLTNFRRINFANDAIYTSDGIHWHFTYPEELASFIEITEKCDPLTGKQIINFIPLMDWPKDNMNLFFKYDASNKVRKGRDGFPLIKEEIDGSDPLVAAVLGSLRKFALVDLVYLPRLDWYFNKIKIVFNESGLRLWGSIDESSLVESLTDERTRRSFIGHPAFIDTLLSINEMSGYSIFQHWLGSKELRNCLSIFANDERFKRALNIHPAFLKSILLENFMKTLLSSGLLFFIPLLRNPDLKEKLISPLSVDLLLKPMKHEKIKDMPAFLFLISLDPDAFLKLSTEKTFREMLIAHPSFINHLTASEGTRKCFMTQMWLIKSPDSFMNFIKHPTFRANLKAHKEYAYIQSLLSSEMLLEMNIDEPTPLLDPRRAFKTEGQERVEEQVLVSLKLTPSHVVAATDASEGGGSGSAAPTALTFGTLHSEKKSKGLRSDEEIGADGGRKRQRAEEEEKEEATSP
jgi:hypothetical protein